MKIILLAMTLLLPSTVAADSSGFVTLRATLSSLNLEDPASDARRNFTHGDLRFIGIRDYSCTAPGREGLGLDALVAAHGLRCLEGTTDAPEGPEHDALQRQAAAYGIKYNNELARLIQDRSD